MTLPSPLDEGETIWTRLARFDRCCGVSVHGLYVDDVRVWEVVITPRNATGEAVRVRRPVLKEALAIAMDQAASRGWAG